MGSQLRSSLWSARETEILGAMAAEIAGEIAKSPKLADLCPEARAVIYNTIADAAGQYIFGAKSKPNPKPVLRLVPQASAR